MLIYRDYKLFFNSFFKGGSAPDYLTKKFKKRSDIHNKDTRSNNKMDIPGYRTALWNFLPEMLTELANLASFKKELMRL